MQEHFTVMTRKGQITVPADIRRALGLSIGDKLAVSLEKTDSGLRASLRPVRSVADMTFGAIKPRRRPEDFDELRELFMEQATERDLRSREEPKP
jgi:AbrB family looped-hinge helix DNA binding protein